MVVQRVCQSVTASPLHGCDRPREEECQGEEPQQKQQEIEREIVHGSNGFDRSHAKMLPEEAVPPKKRLSDALPPDEPAGRSLRRAAPTDV